MFRKKTDILLQTQSRLAKKDVHSLRQILQYCFANYTNSADEQLFGSSPVLQFFMDMTHRKLIFSVSRVDALHINYTTDLH